MNENKIKVFFVGPYISGKNLNHWPAASPAATKWQKFFIKSLSKLDIDFEYIYSRPSSLYPKGKLLPFLEKIPLDFNVKSTQIKYLNFFGLRNLTMYFSLLKKLKRYIKNSPKNQKNFLVSYNNPDFIKKIFSDRLISENFTKISLLADDTSILDADASVFLSFYNFLN
jgi:hypothetical protein